MGEAPPGGVAPDRQKKVPWTTLTNLSASRQVSTGSFLFLHTGLLSFSFRLFTQNNFFILGPFVFLNKGFLSLVLSSFYTQDCYPWSFHLFTQRVFILGPFVFLHKGLLPFVLSSSYTNDFYPFAFIFIHTGFLSLLLSSFLHKGFLSFVLS